MCRWLAYSGEALQPSLVILDAQHSLVAQSLNSPLGNETVNGDGFGFGWRQPSSGTPASVVEVPYRPISTASSRRGMIRTSVS